MPIPGDSKMAEAGVGDVTTDVPDDIFQLVMEESMQAHDNQLTESVANIAHVHNIARNVGVKKFNEVGAIEAAAAEVVMRIKPVTKTT
jgi:hypothetical protein